MTTTDRVQFNATKFEMEIILEIADRAETLARKAYGVQEFDKTSLVMDLDACISNGCPLRLDALRDADDSNFSHDVFGITRHMDRQTGELTDCFLPRFAL